MFSTISLLDLDHVFLRWGTSNVSPLALLNHLYHLTFTSEGLWVPAAAGGSPELCTRILNGVIWGQVAESLSSFETDLCCITAGKRNKTFYSIKIQKYGPEKCKLNILEQLMIIPNTLFMKSFEFYGISCRLTWAEYNNLLKLYFKQIIFVYSSLLTNITFLCLVLCMWEWLLEARCAFSLAAALTRQKYKTRCPEKMKQIKFCWFYWR